MHISLIPVQGFPPVSPDLLLHHRLHSALVKNVVAVKTPETVVPGRTGYFAPLVTATRRSAKYQVATVDAYETNLLIRPKKS